MSPDNAPTQPAPPAARHAVPGAAPSDDPTRRFSDRAADYVKHRPSYPAPAIDALLEGLGPPGSLAAADIGAGTGISSRLLAERGVRVVAVEPNASMRAAGASLPHPLITWRDATGESTGLPDSSADLVLCAQAFHWLDAPRALDEFRRVLRRPPAPARAALVWNTHDTSDPFMRDYRCVILDHATDPPTSPWFTEQPCPLSSAAAWSNYRLLRFPNHQVFDLEGLIGRAISASYSPKQGPAYLALVRDLTDLFHRRAEDARVRLNYITEAHLAEPSP